MQGGGGKGEGVGKAGEHWARARRGKPSLRPSGVPGAQAALA